MKTAALYFLVIQVHITGPPEGEFTGLFYPSSRRVLQRVIFELDKQPVGQKSLNAAVRMTSKALMDRWIPAGIPLCGLETIFRRILKLYSTFQETRDLADYKSKQTKVSKNLGKKGLVCYI